MRIGMALVACIVALGCGKGAAKQCRADAGELTRWLRTLDREGQLFMIDDLRLVGRADLPAADVVLAPTVIIGPDETTYQGQLIGDLEDLALRLTESQRTIQDEVASGRFADENGDPRRLHLVIDELAPWDRIVVAAEAAHRAGFTRPSFVFAAPSRPSTRPPRSWYDDWMDTVNAELRIVERGSQRRPIVENCPSVLRMYADVGRMESGDKVERIVSSIGPALIECGCNVDLPALRSQLWHMLHNPNPVRTLAMELSPEAPPLALPARTSWREASARLTPATGPVWFVVGN